MSKSHQISRVARPSDSGQVDPIWLSFRLLGFRAPVCLPLISKKRLEARKLSLFSIRFSSCPIQRTVNKTQTTKSDNTMNLRAHQVRATIFPLQQASLCSFDRLWLLASSRGPAIPDWGSGLRHENPIGLFVCCSTIALHLILGARERERGSNIIQFNCLENLSKRKVSRSHATKTTHYIRADRIMMNQSEPS